MPPTKRLLQRRDKRCISRDTEALRLRDRSFFISDPKLRPREQKQAGAGGRRHGAADIDGRPARGAGEHAGTRESTEPEGGNKITLSTKAARDREAGAGIESADSGFGERDLTTWPAPPLPT